MSLPSASDVSDLKGPTLDAAAPLPVGPVKPILEEDKEKDKTGCVTCGDKDKKKKEQEPPPDDNNQKYPDGGYHRGGSSAGVDPSQMSRSDYVGKGGAYISAPDGGYHFGGSSAGKDMMMGGAVPGYYNGYTGVLQQGSLGDCADISTVNKMAAETGMDPVTAQTYAMKMDNDLGMMTGPGGTQLTTALGTAGYTGTSVDTSWAIDTSKLGNAQTVSFYSPTAIAATNPTLAPIVAANQQSLGLNLPSGAHAMTMNSVFTAADGTKMVSVSNPWGVNYNLPVSQLPNYGVLEASYGTMPTTLPGK